MADLPRMYLTENGQSCPDCNGTGQGEITDSVEYSDGTQYYFAPLCNCCKGKGRVPVE